MAAISVTYTFINGQTADGSQVNTNFTDITTGLNDGTRDLTVGTVTANTFKAATTLTMQTASTTFLAGDASQQITVGVASASARSHNFFKDVNAGDSTQPVRIRIGNSGAQQGFAEISYTNAAVTSTPAFRMLFSPRNNGNTAATDCCRVDINKVAGNDGGEYTLLTATTAGVLTNAIAVDSSQQVTLGTGTSGVHGLNTSTAATASSGAATLPGNPVGFVIISINGTSRKIPYYAA